MAKKNPKTPKPLPHRSATGRTHRRGVFLLHMRSSLLTPPSKICEDISAALVFVASERFVAYGHFHTMSPLFRRAELVWRRRQQGQPSQLAIHVSGGNLKCAFLTCFKWAGHGTSYLMLPA